jgi:hypothetical protein
MNLSARGCRQSAADHGDLTAEGETYAAASLQALP